MTQQSAPDAHKAALIIERFCSLIYAWRMNKFTEAAQAAEDLFRLGIVIEIPSRLPERRRGRDD